MVMVLGLQLSSSNFVYPVLILQLISFKFEMKALSNSLTQLLLLFSHTLPCPGSPHLVSPQVANHCLAVFDLASLTLAYWIGLRCLHLPAHCDA